MRASKISFLLGSVLLLAIVAWADKIRTDYDHSVNFAKYKTFMWIHQGEIDQPFMRERIMNSVNAELTARGLRMVSDGADLAVNANLATEQRHTWETYYTGGDWYWGGWATTEMETYTVGTLTVDMFDAETHKLIWQGVGVDEVSDKPAKATKDYDKQIEKMFRKFPR
jgi:Domain of unknown function (DUF4136)